LIDVLLKDCYIVVKMKLKETSWLFRVKQWGRNELAWLRPGLGIKRWILLMIAGTALLGFSIAVVVLDIYRTVEQSWLTQILAFLSLRFLPRWLRFVLFSGSGALCIYFSTMGLSRNIIKPFMPQGAGVLDAIASYRRRVRGPNVVVLGGGSGLASILRGLKKHTANITAVVTMADDGGSSGELRRRIGTPPPGDIRNCMTALSDDEAMLTQIFRYRFGEEYNLNGHSLGNLFITALSDITGSFEEGIAEASRVLAITGQVMPATLQDVRLAAVKKTTSTSDSQVIRGESEITKTPGKIERVWLDPDKPQAFPPAIQAILAADLIIVGPGSLYTSILANVLVPDISRALKASKAMKFYVSNITSQPGETDGYTVGDHIKVLEKYLGSNIFDVIICNRYFSGISLPEPLTWVTIDDNLSANYVIYPADLVAKDKPSRHDSDKLAQIVMDLFYERTGPLLNINDDMT